MACLLSTKEVTLPCEPLDQQECRLDIRVSVVNDPIIYGRVFDCEGCPIIGAIVKAFRCRKFDEPCPLCHTFSGCDGWYMLNIPAESLLPSDRILVKAACTDCPPEPCEGAPCEDCCDNNKCCSAECPD
jgi:hypothetical protein